MQWVVSVTVNVTSGVDSVRHSPKGAFGRMLLAGIHAVESEPITLERFVLSFVMDDR